VTVGGKDPGDFAKTAEILWLPCSKLHDHPLHFDFYLQSHLEGLVSSIREAGLIEPLVVSPKGEDYTILSGHYRIRAVRRLKWKKVLCRVITCDDRLAAIIYCTSNVLTRGFSAMEEAHMISGLVLEKHFTLTEIGKFWGRSKSWVSRRLSLVTRLDPKLKKEMEKGFLSPRLAQELARLPRGNDQARVLKRIQSEHLDKDAAAALVSWWLTASEAKRQDLLSKSGPDILAKTVTKQLTDCRILLTRLISTVKGQEVAPWWPLSAYHSLTKTFMELGDVLREQGFSREGRDETKL